MGDSSKDSSPTDHLLRGGQCIGKCSGDGLALLQWDSAAGTRAQLITYIAVVCGLESAGARGGLAVL